MDKEVEALNACSKALDGLDVISTGRVVDYLRNRYVLGGFDGHQTASVMRDYFAWLGEQGRIQEARAEVG